MSLSGVSIAEELSVEEDLAYKVWENESLYPSLSHYLTIAETRQNRAVEVLNPIKDDTFLQGVFDSYSTTSDISDSPASIELNLRQAMQVALSGNRDVQLALLAPAIAESDLKITQTVYDPTLFNDTNYYDSERPIQSLLDTGSDGTDGVDSLTEEGWLTRSGIQQPLPTGGSATVAYEADNLENNSELTIPNPQYTSRFSFELRQSLLKGFGDKSNTSDIRLANISLNQSQAEYRKELADLLRELTLYYWRYSYYYQLEQISRGAIGAAEKILERVETRNEQGIANLLDLDRARSSVEDRRLKHFGDKRLALTTLNQLKQLLGIAPLSPYFHSSLVPTEPFLETFTLPELAQIQRTALTRREEIQIARHELKSAEIKHKLAKHLELPTLDLRTSYTMNGLGEEYGDSVDGAVSDGQDSWDAGIFVEWPIGGRRSALETRKAMLGGQQAKLEYKKSIESISYEVNSLFSEASLSLQEVEASERSKNAYEAVFKRESALYDISRVDNQRLLDSQDEYFDAQRAHLKAVLSLNLMAMNLQWVQGLFLETFGIEP
ncbi:hypothetical protein LA52FAK_34900 [Desulforhopalus sp. 52FAK]